VTSVLLEPVMKLEVVTPDTNVGEVTGDLNKRRAILQGINAKDGYQVVKALVPLSEMFGYVTSLRTLTSGRATSSMEFDSYQKTPESIKEEVINKVRGIISK
jgi:elongation factor G